MSYQPHLPFNNMRYLLSLHAKTDGERTAVIYDIAHGSHKTLSYMELNARAHQTANLLFDDLEIRRGDCIAITASNTPDSLVIMLACWILGVRVLPLNPALVNDQITQRLRENQAILYVVDDAYIDRLQRITGDVQTIRTIFQLGDTKREDCLHFRTLVQNLPTTFLGDDAPVKSDDDRITMNPSDAVASLDDDAITVYDEHQAITWTQRDLLRKARAIANAQTFTGGQRVMGVFGFDHLDSVLFGMIMPLLVGGVVVLDTVFAVDRFWEAIVEARVHVVHLKSVHLRLLLSEAKRTQQAGEGLFGEKVIRQRLTHFRHLVCTSDNLDADLIRRFEDTFGLPVVTGYIAPDANGLSTLLPINLSWEVHQHWLLDHDTPSVGCAIDDDNLDSNRAYQIDDSGRRYYFAG